MLYLLATPIGNLKDISLRGIEILKEADFILAEDTRKAGLLLKYFGIPKKKFISFYEHNERTRVDYIVEKLKQGKNIVLISNAGTPCISDPGYRLVKRCNEERIKITSIPGPCSVINALILSGLPTDSFLFLGFLPKKHAARKKKIATYRDVATTWIIFENPHRVNLLLQDLKDILGSSKRCVIVREMTKIYEEIISASLEELVVQLENKKLKGEITIVLDNRSYP